MRGSRVAPRGIGAPHEHAEHLRHRVPSMACPGFLTVPQGGMSAPPAKRFGVRQLAAALSSCELARRQTWFTQGPKHGQQAGLIESDSKLPHSKACYLGRLAMVWMGSPSNTLAASIHASARVGWEWMVWASSVAVSSARMAAGYPPGPAPITTTPNVSTVISPRVFV